MSKAQYVAVIKIILSLQPKREKNLRNLLSFKDIFFLFFKVNPFIDLARSNKYISVVFCATAEEVIRRSSKIFFIIL